jgi:hypothetical protein
MKEATVSAAPNELSRVSDRLNSAIIEFCRRHTDKEFRMDDLRQYVNDCSILCAPASPDRILRHLRQSGKVVYELVSRPKSLYRILEVQQ